jgi:hypothetical protein
MKPFALFLICAAPLLAAERVDNVLAQMVPDNTVTLIGMRMEQLKTTPLFQKMVAQEQLPQLDEFARQFGFDPRRDVRDLLVAMNPTQSVLLARGSFHINIPPAAKKVNYHGYVIVTGAQPPAPSKNPRHAEQGGFCILDSSLAAAGPLTALEAALDQYKSAKHNNAAVLLARARAIPETYQFWGVTPGGGALISENMPNSQSNGPDFGRIFRSLQDTQFQADLRTGLKGSFEGFCTTAQDAKSLANAARGMVGMGRLQTPENQPDLLKLWDGIKVEQVDRKVTLTTDIAQDLIDQLLKLMQPNAKRKS